MSYNPTMFKLASLPSTESNGPFQKNLRISTNSIQYRIRICPIPRTLSANGNEVEHESQEI